ncbi:PucR family transcriptional regulator [Scopulibacillus darangshiensis]|nr:PucR family transcriptional regulator [Scopulibacillus darangshiensis]
MTIGDALCIPPLEQCTVIAGKKGLDRMISSINSYDAPDVINWLKQGDLVLTTGYVFKNDEQTQIKVIEEMAKRNCAGLGIKINSELETLPEVMIRIADDNHVPLIKIPYHLSLSDMILSIFREMFARQDLNDAENRKKAFLSKLLQGEYHGRDAVLAEGRTFGLVPGQYVCLCLRGNNTNSDISGLADSICERSGISLILQEKEELTMILQAPKDQDGQQIYDQAFQVAKSLIDEAGNTFPNLVLKAGIGTCQDDVLRISDSCKQAQEALQLGKKQRGTSSDNIYHFNSLEAYAVLQHIPESVLESFIANKLGAIMQHDKDNHSDLMKTLEVYLLSRGRTSDAARLLGVHRNTIGPRLTKIKELLELDIENGEVVFQLQLALHLFQLQD